MRLPRLAGIIGILMISAGCTLLPQEEEYAIPVLQEPPPSRTIVHTVTTGSIREEITSVGRVSPVLETNLYFTSSGIIRTMDIQPQQRVEAGQILAQLEIGDKEHQRRLADLSLEQERLRLEQQEDLARIEGRENSVDMQIRRLAMQREEENYSYLLKQIDAATILAPYDGVISRVYKQAGNRVSEYETIFTIQDPSELEVGIELTSEDDFNKITIGTQVEVEITKNNWVTAYITQIPSYSERNASNPAERDRKVRIRFDKPDGVSIKMGDMFSTVIVVREEPEAILIPRNALHDFMGRKYVRVKDGDVQREVDVATGIITPTHVQIVKGLEPGMTVVGR